MSEFLIYEQTGAIVTLTMNRPDERNALSDDSQFQEFVDVCGRINRDRSVRVAILTGAGTAFCAGGNVKRMRALAGKETDPPFAVRERYLHGIQRIALAVYHLEVPSIAAVNGPAIGAGCDLACMCDLRIASQQARFAESFVKLGLIAGDGGAWLLPRVVGMSKACELAFTGEMIDADEALVIGLVSKVVAPETLMDEAGALAAKIAANPPHALRLTKRLLREGQHVRIETLLEMSAAFQALSHFTEDHTEAVEAFFEKRTPQFKGK